MLGPCHRPTTSNCALALEHRLGVGRIRPALLRVVLGQALVDGVDAMREGDAIDALDVLNNVTDEVGKFEDGEFVTVAEVDWARLARAHEHDQTVDQIVDVLE